MTYLHYTHTRTRSRSRSRERTPIHTHTHTHRPLIRHSPKHHLSEDSDDGYDDYPYAPNHKPAKPSRALTLRNPSSQLERYNIWSDRRPKHTDDERREQDRQVSIHRWHDHEIKRDEDNYDETDERAFHLKVHATFSRPRSPSPPRHAHVWPGTLFRRHEKFVDEEFEARERTRSPPRRRVSFWDEDKDDAAKREDEDEVENWTRYRHVKRTQTEEWKPLCGWRRG